MDIFYGNNQRVAQWLLEPGAQASLASPQQAGQRLFRLSINPMSDWLLICTLRTFDLIHWSLATLPRPSSSLVMTRRMMGRFYLRCLSLTPRNLLVVPSSWISKMDSDIVHESSMLSMKRRFANILANTNVNSSGNLDTYNLFALSMMITMKRSFPTMS
jgi:hypothetical protein